jgi:hypothetical protein
MSNKIFSRNSPGTFSKKSFQAILLGLLLTLSVEGRKKIAGDYFPRGAGAILNMSPFDFEETM